MGSYMGIFICLYFISKNFIEKLMRIEENIKMDKGLSLISMTFFDLTNIIFFC